MDHNAVGSRVIPDSAEISCDARHNPDGLWIDRYPTSAASTTTGGQVPRSRLIALAVVCLLLFAGVAFSSVAIWTSANVIPSTPEVVKSSHRVVGENDHDADDVAGGGLVDDQDTDNDD